MITDEQRAFEKALRELRQKAKKLRDRKHSKFICELAYWGTAYNDLSSTMRELKEQRENQDED